MNDERKRFMFDFIADQMYAIGEVARENPPAATPDPAPIKIRIWDGVPASVPPPEATEPHRLLEATVARLATALALPAERMAELREHVHAAARDLYTTTGHTYASALALIEDTLIGGGFEHMADALRDFAEKAIAAGVEIGDGLRPLVPKLPPGEIDWTALEVPALRPRKLAGSYTRGLLRRLRR